VLTGRISRTQWHKLYSHGIRVADAACTHAMYTMDSNNNNRLRSDGAVRPLFWERPLKTVAEKPSSPDMTSRLCCRYILIIHYKPIVGVTRLQLLFPPRSAHSPVQPPTPITPTPCCRCRARPHNTCRSVQASRQLKTSCRQCCTLCDRVDKGARSFLARKMCSRIPILFTGSCGTTLQT